MTDKLEQKRLSRRRFLKRAGITLGACAALYGEARLVEPNWIDVSRHTVFLPELPLEMDGMTIAHLSDIHYGPVTPVHTITTAIALAAEEKADLVALTGDFVNREVEEALPLIPLLEPLRGARFGLIGCLGNHDYRDYSGNGVTKILEKNDIRVLRNQSEPLAKGLFIAGIEDTMRGDPHAGRALANVPHTDACIFLTHNPTGVWGVTRRSCVALSGHTHGGQIRVPLIKPHLPAGMEGFPMYEGWGTFDKAQLFISRGVGMMHSPLRFCCRPEVAILTLKRGEGLPQTTTDMMARGRHKAKSAARTVYHWFA